MSSNRFQPPWKAMIGAATALWGCSHHPDPPVAADALIARAALVAALDAWVAAKTPAELQSARPDITVADEDWQRGQSLASYELLANEQLVGSAIRWPVRLRLGTAGREQDVDVLYIVETNPAIHISRAD